MNFVQLYFLVYCHSFAGQHYGKEGKHMLNGTEKIDGQKNVTSKQSDCSHYLRGIIWNRQGEFSQTIRHSARNRLGITSFNYCLLLQQTLTQKLW